MSPIKAIVIGPTEHTRTCLEEILNTPGYKVEAVFGSDTSWKHRKARWTTFDDLEKKYGFTLKYCDVIKNPANIELMKQIKPDVIFEFGASEMISKEILDLPKYGCIGSHGGPLPNYKGGSSLNWALLLDKKEWGVTLYYLAEKADEGDIIGVGMFDINDRDDINTVHLKSDYHIKEMLKTALADLRDKGYTTRIKQSPEGQFLPQRKPKDGEIDWNKNPREVFNFIRAQTHPFPGAFTYLNLDKDANIEKDKVHIWKSTYTGLKHPGSEENGAVLGLGEYYGRKGMWVKCNGGKILIEQVTKSGDTEMWASDFFKVYNLSKDSRFYNAPK